MCLPCLHSNKLCADGDLQTYKLKSLGKAAYITEIIPGEAKYFLLSCLRLNIPSKFRLRLRTGMCA